MTLSDEERSLLMDGLNALLDSPDTTPDEEDRIDALFARLREGGDE